MSIPRLSLIMEAARSSEGARRLFDDAERDLASGDDIDRERLQALIDIGRLDVRAAAAAENEAGRLESEVLDLEHKAREWKDWGLDVLCLLESLLEDCRDRLPAAFVVEATRLINEDPS